MNLFRHPNLSVFNEKVFSKVNLQSFNFITLVSANDKNNILNLINLLKEELQNWELTIKVNTYTFSRRNHKTKLRFSDIEIGNTFYFNGLKLKKNDNYNAVASQGKKWFFNRKDIVSVERNKFLYVFVYVRIEK